MAELVADFKAYKITDKQKENIANRVNSWYIIYRATWDGDILQAERYTRKAGSHADESLRDYIMGLMDGLPKKEK